MSDRLTHDLDPSDDGILHHFVLVEGGWVHALGVPPNPLDAVQHVL